MWGWKSKTCRGVKGLGLRVEARGSWLKRFGVERLGEGSLTNKKLGREDGQSQGLTKKGLRCRKVEVLKLHGDINSTVLFLLKVFQRGRGTEKVPGLGKMR